VSADFVARLGSRAPAPDEVRSAWELGDYLARLDRPGAADELSAIVRRARRRRRLDPDRLHAVLAALADPPAAELNKARIAAAAGLPVTTLSPYVDVLVHLDVVRLLPGCRAAVAKRAIGRPAAVFADPGLARHLTGASSAALEDLGGRRLLTDLLRGAVAAELLRQRETARVEHRVSHLRERNGLEVDLVIELPDDTLFGIEVRTAASLRPHQFASLHALARRAGGRFRGGVVLNTATRGHRYGARLWSLPIATVWD
jgi:predicted AAA+ superfamily ATPase